MDIRHITDRYHVSPQINPEDAPAIKDAGIAMVICNRPDAEVPPSHQSDAMRAAVEAAGLRFEVLPLTHQTMTPDRVAEQAALVAQAEGPVLAYCASGTRCSIVWALSQAGQMDADAILDATGRAGYDLSGMRPTLDALAAGAR
ncbi:TIGR01244 family sulfur transferase [Marivita sp. S6314]|uniref:TIGR01244 family sulfur transferase n=1 Tax=Marivita sp. S6314 TaxID=2926406 RepID=UPI001FF13445|nr:TIGR01244 family sulfur transferase [Marivita sp. S6314]MCK0149244.1 TIGR01244 family sulfur transferase [Marivita sp. S6314]